MSSATDPALCECTHRQDEHEFSRYNCGRKERLTCADTQQCPCSVYRPKRDSGTPDAGALDLDALREAAVANARANSEWDAVLALIAEIERLRKEVRRDVQA